MSDTKTWNLRDDEVDEEDEEEVDETVSYPSRLELSST